MRDAATDDSNQRLTNEQPPTGNIVLWLELAEGNQQDEASVRASVPAGAEILPLTIAWCAMRLHHVLRHRRSTITARALAAMNEHPPHQSRLTRRAIVSHNGVSPKTMRYQPIRGHYDKRSKCI